MNGGARVGGRMKVGLISFTCRAMQVVDICLQSRKVWHRIRLGATVIVNRAGLSSCLETVLRSHGETVARSCFRCLCATMLRASLDAAAFGQDCRMSCMYDPYLSSPGACTVILFFRGLSIGAICLLIRSRRQTGRVEWSITGRK